MSSVYSTTEVQKALVAAGYRIDVDGIWGPQTEKAISDFKGDRGWRRRPLIGPLTAKALGLDGPMRVPSGEDTLPPWLHELGRHMYKHEIRDNAYLRKWLKSDGRTLGDPAKLPWCGDAMATAVRLTLPDEPFPGALGENPYWARNWVYFGQASTLKHGCLIVIVRKGGGHIASAIGYDPDRRRIRIRGGNQANRISDVWVKEARVIGVPADLKVNIRRTAVKGIREPRTYGRNLPPIPIMNSRGAVISRNES